MASPALRRPGAGSGRRRADLDPIEGAIAEVFKEVDEQEFVARSGVGWPDVDPAPWREVGASLKLVGQAGNGFYHNADLLFAALARTKLDAGCSCSGIGGSDRVALTSFESELSPPAFTETASQLSSHWKEDEKTHPRPVEAAGDFTPVSSFRPDPADT
jgi:hypothetical protein